MALFRSVDIFIIKFLLNRKHYISVKEKSFYTMGLVNI